ncbi:MAG: ABC transporter permease [Patescibacteria group bacterium]|nr:ABC transporter permease [Patescibacteria group bacterium]
MSKATAWIIAKKEYRDALKSVLFLSLLVFLFLLTAVSLLVAGFDFQSQVAQYNVSIAQLHALGQTGVVLEKPQYFPLQMLRGTIEYLEIIGAIIGIVLGYVSIAKEKGNNTLQLLLSRPVSRLSFVIGKVIGNSLLLLSLLGVIIFFIVIAIAGIGHVAFSSTELVKLILSFVFSYVYLMFFYSLSAFLCLLFMGLSNALVVGFVIWLLIVLIVPQVGDTMDPDNQIPGGFFNRMHMTKTQQRGVIVKFKTYETIRNVLEESSVEKHYERLVFATLGIKDMYNGKTLSVIFQDKWGDWGWVTGYYFFGMALFYVVFNNKRIFGKKT